MSTETVLGGVPITVTKQDGTTEGVIVRDLPMNLLQAYWDCVESEEKTIELFCAKESGWALSLSRQSFEQIITEGEQRNLDFLLRFSQRKAGRREKISPGLEEKVIGNLVKELAERQFPSPASNG